MKVVIKRVPKKLAPWALMDFTPMRDEMPSNILAHLQAADHLVDDVLPLVPYRQMVLNFPLRLRLRYWTQSNRKLFAKGWVCHDRC